MFWNPQRQFFMIAWLCAIGIATAQADVFFDQASYDAASGTNVVPDYDSLAAIDFPLGTTDFYGHFDVTSAGGAGTTGSDATFNSAGNFVWNFDPTNLSSVVFTFDEPIIGFSGNWSNTFVQDGFRVTTPSNSYDLNDLVTDLNATFIGITESTPFSTVTFSTSENIPGDDFVFFRAFTYAPVPEPASSAIAGLLTLGLLLMRRR